LPGYSSKSLRPLCAPAPLRFKIFDTEGTALPIPVAIVSKMRRLKQEDLNDLARAKYVQRFPEYFFVWPVVKQRRTSFVLQSLKDARQKLTYRPNVSYYAGAGTYIFGIGFQLVAAIPQNNSTIERFGESRAVDLQANILGKNWASTFLRKTTKATTWMIQTGRFLPARRTRSARTSVPGIQE